MSRSIKWLLTFALLSLAGIALWLWTPWKSSQAELGYRTGQVEKGPLSAAISASGTLNALITVQVGSQVSGQVNEIRADYNSPVKQGQIIARIDPETFETRLSQAEAELKSAESTAEVARVSLSMRQSELAKTEIAYREALRNRERKQALIKQGFLSPAEMDSVQAEADTAQENKNLAEAELRVARAQLDNALSGIRQRQSALRQARAELERTIIRSPVDGIVISRSVDVGQTVAASFQAPVLFTLAKDLSEMEVNIAVDEADVGRVAEGQKVQFTVDAFPGERFSGQVIQIRKFPQLSNNVVTYTVIARVANPELKLLPGMTANARILTDERQDVIKVPNAALRFRPVQADGSPVKLDVRAREEGPGLPGRVWRLGKAGQPEEVPVRIGVSDGRSTEILKGDVTEGSEIILGLAEDTANRPGRAHRPVGGL